MRKGPLLSILVIVFVLVAIVGALISYSLQRSEREIAMREPVDVAYLTELGRRLEKVEVEASDLESVSTENNPSPTTQNPPINPAALPTQLNSTVSRQRLSQHYVPLKPSERLEIEFRMNILKLDESVSNIFGKEKLNGIHTTAAIGYELKHLGKYEEAERYLWEGVKVYEEADPTQCKVAMCALAWLEEDPEMAAQLLYVSCQGDFSHINLKASNLLSAYKLCVETESTVLAEHYLTRLYTECPEQAKKYHERTRIPSLIK